MSELFETEARTALKSCDELATSAITSLLQAIQALEELPDVLSSDREGDARAKAVTRCMKRSYIHIASRSSRSVHATSRDAIAVRAR